MNVFTRNYAELMLCLNNLTNIYIILKFYYNDPKYVEKELPMLIFFFAFKYINKEVQTSQKYFFLITD